MNVQRKRLGVRLLPENHEWLAHQASRHERSMNYILDKTLTEAREADEARQGGDNADKH